MRLHRLPWLVALASHALGVLGAFTLDDVHAVLGHPAVNGRGTLRDAFVLTFWGQPLGTPPASWRPVTTLSLALDARLSGTSPSAMHAVSLALFCLLVAEVHGFARRYLEPRAALVAVCLFAAMPLHVENVASLVGRADVLALLLGLVALRPGSSRAASVLAALAFAGSLLSKESALALVGVAALLAVAEAPGDARRGAWSRAAVLGCVAVAYLAVRLVATGSVARWSAPDDVLDGAAAWQRAVYAVEYAARAMQLVVAPFDLCTGRKFAMLWRPETPLTPFFAAGAALLAAAGWSSWAAWRAQRPAWAACACGTALMFTGLAWKVPEAMADRFFLAPTLFLALAIAPAITGWWSTGGVRRTLVAALVALNVALSAWQSTRWRDDVTLLAHSVAACPDSAHDHFRLAGVLEQRGAADEAAWHAALAYECIRRFPHRWRHPALDAEDTLPAAERVRRLPALLHADGPDGPWRAAVAAYARRNGFVRAAERIAPSSRP